MLLGGSIQTAPAGVGDSSWVQLMRRTLLALSVATSSAAGAPMLLQT